MNTQRRLIAAMSLCAAVAVPGLSFGALIDRGGGLIYDDVLVLTWLQDANLAATNTFGVTSIAADAAPYTFGIRPDGTMSWDTAQSWIGALNSNGYLGYNDWRLPVTTPLDGSAFNFSYSYDGSTDNGFNISEQGTAYAGSTASEMAHLFYNTLNNKGWCNPDLSTASFCSAPQAGYGLANSGPFINIQSNHYWSETDSALNTYTGWNFNFDNGAQDAPEAPNNSDLYVWAVRPGDVSAVPVPAAAWLFGSGLLALLGVSRKTSTH